MENIAHTFEDKDPWREAILAERTRHHMPRMLKAALKEYSGDRNNALVLGDASLVQSDILLNEEAFGHVVDVDSSPSLLDDEIVPVSDTRLERILKEFDQYEPREDTFDLVYGKSIAFNPKETIELVLKRLATSLKDNGLFYALFASEGDSFRQGIFYSREELEHLLARANLVILKLEEHDNSVTGLITPGRAHEFEILAQKK